MHGVVKEGPDGETGEERDLFQKGLVHLIIRPIQRAHATYLISRSQTYNRTAVKTKPVQLKACAADNMWCTGTFVSKQLLEGDPARQTYNKHMTVLLGGCY